LVSGLHEAKKQAVVTAAYKMFLKTLFCIFIFFYINNCFYRPQPDISGAIHPTTGVPAHLQKLKLPFRALLRMFFATTEAGNERPKIQKINVLKITGSEIMIACL
jgi:hypothetical protein